jgi:hypothetical protein
MACTRTLSFRAETKAQVSSMQAYYAIILFVIGTLTFNGGNPFKEFYALNIIRSFVSILP